MRLRRGYGQAGRQKQKVKYWNDYRIPVKDAAGKTKYQQRREYIGYSIEDAKAASGKRKVQKKENRIFDMLPGTDLTFNELAGWYLNLEKVKEIRSYERIRIGINRFNEVFGNRLVNEIQNVDLENYQVMRSKKVKPRTVDYELSVAGTMVNKAFYNGKISDAAFLAFKSISNLVPLGSNARDRVASIEDISAWQNAAAHHIKPVIITAFNTGMRSIEIRQLRWDHVDLENGFFWLPKKRTKENKPKSIPTNNYV